MSEELVDFYKEHKISPVRQDIRDLQKHFFRRQALYRHLGLLPATIRGQSILEVGPGSGYNALYTASLKPKRYVLLEGNPTGVSDIKELFSQFSQYRKPVEVVNQLLQEFSPAEKFDVVLCEGMLSGVPDPKEILKLLTQHVTPGGILVITCIDQISYYSETLRRFAAQRIIEPSDSLEIQTKKMIPAFAPHLAKLPGVSRSPEDWIIDSMINPASIGPLLSIADAINTVQSSFDFYASSPHFVTDLRWYKAVDREDPKYNAMALEQYWRTVHNFLDCRYCFEPRPQADNETLFKQCEATRSLVRSYEKTRDSSLIERIIQEIDATALSASGFSEECGRTFHEVATLFSKPSMSAEDIGNAPLFSLFFGRGQQYVSFTHRS